MAIRIKARPNERAEQMMRRFKKLCEKEGLTKDIKRRAYYEKPSERKQRALRKSVKRAQQLLNPQAVPVRPRQPQRPRGSRATIALIMSVAPSRGRRFLCAPPPQHVKIPRSSRRVGGHCLRGAAAPRRQTAGPI
jgi:small subunit ribosomal protein S21